MRSSVSRWLAAVLLLAGFAPSFAAAAEILTPVPPAVPTPVLESDKTIKRQRAVNVNAAALAAAIVPPGYDFAADRVDRSRQSNDVATLRLFDDSGVDLRRVSVENGLDGGIIWQGESTAGDHAILVVRDGRITGYIERRGKSYLIDPLGSGSLHRVREIEPNAYLRDKHMEAPPRRDQKSLERKPTPAAPAEGMSEVTLLATYTQRARSNLGASFKDKIKLDVARVNKALQNSGVDLRIKLVGFKPVASNYDELAANDSGAPLEAITTGTSHNFPDLRQWRTTVSADLVTMYTMRPEYCGLAWVNYPGVSGNYSFSVINSRCQGSLTLAHELGHNMGLYHDRYVERSAAASHYNYGYVDVAGRFRDIMSYSDKCDDQGVSCQEIPYFSTTLRNYSGRRIGVPKGSSGAADAARLLNENRVELSRIR